MKSLPNQTPPASNQDALNRVWEYFVINDNPRSTDKGRCLYRSPNGSACGVGCMMPDDMAKKADEQYDLSGYADIKSIREELVNVNEWFSKVDKSFLSSLQKEHDNESFTEERKRRRLTELASRYSLSVN